MALSAVGIFFRTVLGLHSTWLVNSTHAVGVAAISGGDTSQERLLNGALLTFGEGWHNNRHAHPQSLSTWPNVVRVRPNWYGISALRMIESCVGCEGQKTRATDPTSLRLCCTRLISAYLGSGRGAKRQFPNVLGEGRGTEIGRMVLTPAKKAKRLYHFCELTATNYGAIRPEYLACPPVANTNKQSADDVDRSF